MLPNLPGSVSACPHLFEVKVVLEHIHGFPEPAMLESVHFAGIYDVREWFAFEHDGIGILGQEVKDLGFADKESGVDPITFANRFLLERGYNSRLLVNANSAKASSWLIDCHRESLATFVVSLYGFGDVEVCHTIAVSETELLLSHIFADSLQAACSHRVEPGIYDGNLPVLGVVLVELEAIVAQVECDIGVKQEIVHEVFLDDVLLVAGTDDEFVDAVCRIRLHDVPEDGLAANLNHRLRHVLGLLAESCAKTASKNNCFHMLFFGVKFVKVAHHGANIESRLIQGFGHVLALNAAHF